MNEFCEKYIFGNKSFFIFGIFFALSLLFYGLIDRVVHIDDAWLGEQVYFLNQLGYVKSELWNGLLGYEKELFVYHKGFILIGALFTNMFGFSLVSLKSVSLVFYFLSFFLLLKYSLNQNFSKISILFGSLLYFSNHLLFEYGFIFRPETTLMFIGFLQFICLKNFLDTDRWKWLILGSIIAGVGVFIHLNGLIFLPAGFILLLYSRKFKQIFVFTLLSVTCALSYFYNISSYEELMVFKSQFFSDPALVQTNQSILGRFSNILNEHQRWFSHHHNISFSLLLFYSLYVSFRRFQNRNELIFLGVAIFTLSVISHGQTAKYLIYYMPFLILITMRAFDAGKNRNRVTIVLLFLFLSINLFQNHRLTKNSLNLNTYNETALETIPLGSKVAGYMAMFFDN
ncbi:MAG: glycosyltransferase family 39 protein, partial [Bdellovibrionales bacterium]